MAAMRGMTKEELLECLVGLNVPAAEKIRAELEEARQLQVASKKAFADASKQARTIEGRQTWHTLLTAAAYDGDGPSKVSSKRKAELLGVHEPYLTAARQRVRALKPDLIPTAAMEENAYWYQPRAKRSEATPPELLELMRRFWHTDGVSRATGNSKDMYRESKRPGAPSHPRRQLMVPGGGETVFPMFFEWPDYINFKKIWKAEKGEDIQDPGRTLFLSTRCECLAAPKTDQCACKIHTQQDLYLKALREVTVQGRQGCKCRWCTDKDGDQKWKHQWTNLATFSDAIACPKVDLRAGDPHDQHGFMGRKPECSSFDCAVCGFGRDGGIPTCEVLECSDQLVKWTRYEDVKRPGKKPLPNQQVEREGKLCDLWAEFKKHSKLYMAHHAKAKWQRDSHGLCLSTFKDGDIVIEKTDKERNDKDPATKLFSYCNST